MSEVAVRDAVAAYLQRKAVGNPGEPGSGTYAANAESILRRWADWLETEHETTVLFNVEVDHLRSYAAVLEERTNRGEYTASTARTYFAVVRAFLSWCVRGGLLESNPATAGDAERLLPVADDRSEEQFWATAQRRELEAFVRERALEAEDGSRRERLGRLREYAMVAVLAHAGVRGAELFRVPEDARRTGATWGDVDFYAGTIRVLGTSQRLEDVTLPAAARTPLRRYRVVVEPPSNEWPLFPTRHAPSIARRVRSELLDRGRDERAVDELFEESTAVKLAREHAIAPPAITTEGARSILKRLCESADVDVDGEYLKPGGARRGRDDRRYRRAATSSQPGLRASVLERSIAVVEERARSLGGRPERDEASEDG